MGKSILIYGANGYTGRLISKEAKKQDIQVHLAGRNKDAIATLAEDLALPFYIISLEETKNLEDLLKQFDTVIHCAGPFSETAKPMVEACIATNTNYLDITGEIWVFEDIMKYHEQAKAKGIALIPGAGFDVVPTDCLAAQLKEALPDGNYLEMAFVGSKTSMSRGTAVTMVKNISKGGFIREDGQIKSVPLAYEAKEITFPHRKQWCMTIPWGDLMTTYHHTGIENIKIFSGASHKMIKRLRILRSLKFLLGIPFIQKLARNKVENSVTGPNQKMLSEGSTYIVGTLRNEKNDIVKMTLTCPEAYFLTAKTALKIAIELSSNTEYNGYLTPAQAFGKDFILGFEGVKLTKTTNKG